MTNRFFPGRGSGEGKRPRPFHTLTALELNGAPPLIGAEADSLQSQ
jgi:hypothetical protein